MTEKERAYVTVDLGAVRSNFDELTKDLPQEMKAIAVVKADGYGHGALPIAKMLENDPKLGFFAVATESEAISLSLGEIEKPVLILSHTVPEYDDELIQRKIRFTVASEKRAEELSGAAGKAGAKAFVHLKIDTGMGRIGFFPDEESVKAIKAIAKLPNLVLEGIFTHLSSMDMEDPSFSIGQAEKMERFVNRLKEEGIGFPFVHVGNSAGTILKRGFPSFANATRLGISLYGAAPSGEGNFSSVRLTPAMSFFSRVAFLKTVPAGTPIGYGRTYVTERETVVATVSAGYADGYMRSLSNKGTVLIRGIRCRVIGRVCMDQFMADVTEVPDVSIGDRVLLFGRDGNEELPVSEVAEQAGTIPYELLVRTGVRLTKTVIYG